MALPGETLGKNPPKVCPHTGDELSEMKVLHSAAGYYVGTEVKDAEFGYWEPYSRESGYYPTREAAEKALSSGEFDR